MFTITVSDELKSLSSDEIADKLAEFRMSSQRTCTSFAKPFDEVRACDGGRVDLWMAQLDKLTKGKACEMVSARYNVLKSEISQADWESIVKQRDAWLARFHTEKTKVKPFEP